MKKIIDVSSPEDETFALTLIDKVQVQNPNQVVGSKGTVAIKIRDKTFNVTRNTDSYTVEEGTPQKEQQISLGV